MIVTGPPPNRYPWEPITLAEQLERTAARHGARDAVIAGTRRLTWSEVRTSARRLAKGLLRCGLGRGDHIALWVPNSVEWLVTWLASAYTGCVVIPVNTRYQPKEVRYILRQSDARLLVMVDRFLDIDYLAMLHRLCPRRADGSLDTGEFPELGRVALTGGSASGTESLAELTARGDTVPDTELDAHAATVQWDDPTIIVYTSGTTGYPKGAVHSHAILRNECSISEWLEIDADSRILNHMPFFHVAGAMTGILPGVITGAGLVLMEHWDPRRALELVATEKVSVLSGIPTHFIDLLDSPDLAGCDTSSLRTGWIGGASVPRAVISGAVERLGLAGLLPVYGMTETTSVTTFPRITDPPEIVLSAKGLPVSDFELKVVGVASDRVASGDELDADVEGEICVRGHLVMQGYYRDPAATAEVIDGDGWFHTGDLGVLDAHGYLSVTGRKSDMFIVGGSNTYPAEIEAVLTGHEKIRQAYVVGVPEDRLGEVGFAFVELTAGEQLSEADVITFCRQRLADFKVPRFVDFVESWPLTSTGKIQRFRLGELAVERAGVAD